MAALINRSARFVLDRSSNRRLECPSCGKREYRRFVDRYSSVELPYHVGICNRENNCAYSYTAKQWLADGGQVENMEQMSVPPPPPRKTDWRCPKLIFDMTQGKGKDGYPVFTANHLVDWMLGTRLGDSPLRAITEYELGTYPMGKNHPELACASVFWQIGVDGKARSGKVVQYDPDTGRRRKDVKATWMHSIATGKPMGDIGCAQVYFGEHLLKKYPDKTVCIVESEKTALICSCLFPEYVWLATGGSNSLSIDKSMILSGSRVILFPDKGMYDLWSEKSLDIEPMLEYLHVSDVLERIDAEDGSDIADYLVPEERLTAEDLFPERLPVLGEEEDGRRSFEEWTELVEEHESKKELVESPVDRILARPEVANFVKEFDLDTSKLKIKPYEQTRTSQEGN